MTDLHALVHDAVSTWLPFAIAAALLGAAALAFALLVGRRGARLLSARSRYMLLSIALIAPLAGALFIPTQLGGWAKFLAAPGVSRAPVAGGTVDTSIRFTSVDAAGAPVDILCVLAALWAVAFLAVLLVRAGERAMWRRIASRSVPLDDARVGVIFRAAWKDRGAPPAVRTSRDCDEPMVVGLARPTILLPHGYGERMDDAEVEAVAVHELEHVRRRDNMDAAVIDLLTSLFWFDPFHWIARNRLLALREGACDERVLERGLAPHAYLSALAKTSHAAVESPAVACMSGFRIRERMDSIMTYANRRSKWIPESLVRVAGLAMLTIVAIAIAGFAPATAGTPQSTGAHKLDVRIMPGPEGQALITAQITTPDGTLVSAGKIRAAAGLTATTITSVGGRDYKLSVTPAADGSGLAKLQVLEGDEVIDTVVERIDPPAPPPPGYERVGDDVEPPKILTRVSPAYPEEARKERTQGMVIVEVLIGADGALKDVKALNELPHGLTEAAVDAVRQWTFAPALKDDKPVPVAFKLTINFKLDAGKKAEEKQ